MRNIGILGGTFDPPHIGHLIIAEEVRLALNLDEIWFIPSNVQVHKGQAEATAKDRLRMVQCAIESNPYFKVNSIEINRTGKSYTIDTIRQLLQQYTHNKFYFIIGADMVEYLPHWKNIDELIKLITFVGVKRYGFSLKSSYPLVQVNIPEIHISSTDIRNRLANKQHCRYLIPNCVYNYIKENKLYGYRNS
ncbi:MAG TPA: nicotinate-nucleotide adenylyltransferase [Bacillota bacterium]|nr:nicotinate-nucleotide adenylyltransferase [Bacillota bacterium]